MYYIIILTDTSGKEIAQRAVSNELNDYWLKMVAQNMLDKHGRDTLNTTVSVVRWDGKCYETVEKNLLKDVAQEECVG